MAKAPIPSATYERELVGGSIKGAMRSAEAAEKTGLWMIPVGNIRRLDGFNVRIITPAYEQHIEELEASITQNGFYPNKPLAGYVAKEEGEDIVYVTDGYSRLTAVERAIEKGVEIDKLPVILKPATTNMADLTIALIQDNEGSPLTVYERALVVKRLMGYGVETPEIARRLNITDRYVADLVLLAGAPSKVRNMVIAGKISPTEAIKQLRKNPEKAAGVLQAAVDAATAEGKAKASAKHVGDAGGDEDDDGETKYVQESKKTTRGKSVEKKVFRLKGGEKVRKGLIEDVLNLAGGNFWREPEELDDADEGDVIITETIEIAITVTRAAEEGAEDDADAGQGEGGDEGDADEGSTDGDDPDGEGDSDNGGL